MAASIHSEDGDIGFQIAPMVDVVFVLLLFFMACVGMKMQERAMKISVPGHGPGTPTAIVVDISPEGLVSVNNKVLGQPGDHQLRELRGWLSNAVETFGGEDPVILCPSPVTQHERIMEVLDSAIAAKVQKLSFN
jgi:biopolymer transport protein ExbD